MGRENGGPKPPENAGERKPRGSQERRKQVDTKIFVGPDRFVRSDAVDSGKATQEILEEIFVEKGIRLSPEKVEEIEVKFQKDVQEGLSHIERQEKDEAEKKAEKKAFLSGMLGRFRERVYHEIKRPEMLNKVELGERFVKAVEDLQPGQKIVFVFVDLDSLKKINDVLGHGAGDELIKSFSAGLKTSVANSLEQALRKSGDVVARLGGDEFGFMMVMPEQIPDSLVVKRVISETQGLTKRPGTIESQSEIQELSVGYAVVTHEDVQGILQAGNAGDLFEQKYEEADQRAYISKKLQYTYLKKGGKSEIGGKKLASVERIVGPQTAIEESLEELEHFEAVHKQMRPLAEQFPKAEESVLAEYASLMIDIPQTEDPELLASKLSRFAEIAKEVGKGKK